MSNQRRPNRQRDNIKVNFNQIRTVGGLNDSGVQFDWIPTAGILNYSVMGLNVSRAFR